MMIHFIRFIVLGLLLIISNKISAQVEISDHEKEHKNHVGLGFAASHIPETQGLKPGFHVHYLHQLGQSEHWALGVGYEGVINEQLHNGINLLLNFRPVHKISLNAGPGLVFEKHEGKFEVTPAFHTEAVFEFEINNIHLGPLVGYGFDKDDSHFSFGVHLGYGF